MTCRSRVHRFAYCRRRAWAVILVILSLLLVLTSYTRSGSYVDPIGGSILVFAPHPDDETLALGGLIHEAVIRGSRVCVVFVTSGDGYRAAAARISGRIAASPKRCIHMGQVRMQEATQALSELGVGSNSIVFLGYPDRGLAHMWDSHWSSDNPYISPHTAVQSVPYDNAFRPGAPYSGSAVAADIMDILTTFNPDTVFVPDPIDTHNDHWATYNMVAYALASLEHDNHIKVFAYPVHSGSNFPIPRGYAPRTPLTPPDAVPHAVSEWFVRPIGNESRHAKLRALNAYRSQLDMMPFYLKSFVRSNEVFAVIRTLDPYGSGDTTRPALKVQQRLAASSPAHPDTARSSLLPAGEIGYIEVAARENDIVFTAHLGPGTSSRVTCLLDLAIPHGTHDGSVTEARIIQDSLEQRTMATVIGTSPRRYQRDGTGLLVSFAIPVGKLTHSSAQSALFQVRLELNGRTIARSGWITLRLRPRQGKSEFNHCTAMKSIA